MAAADLPVANWGPRPPAGWDLLLSCNDYGAATYRTLLIVPASHLRSHLAPCADATAHSECRSGGRGAAPVGAPAARTRLRERTPAQLGLKAEGWTRVRRSREPVGSSQVKPIPRLPNPHRRVRPTPLRRPSATGDDHPSALPNPVLIFDEATRASTAKPTPTPSAYSSKARSWNKAPTRNSSGAKAYTHTSRPSSSTCSDPSSGENPVSERCPRCCSDRPGCGHRQRFRPGQHRPRDPRPVRSHPWVRPARVIPRLLPS
jgi:hypothetical protein